MSDCQRPLYANRNDRHWRARFFVVQQKHKAASRTGFDVETILFREEVCIVCRLKRELPTNYVSKLLSSKEQSRREEIESW